MLYRRSNFSFVLLPLPDFWLLHAWAGQSAQQLLWQWVSREKQQRTKSLSKTSLPVSEGRQFVGRAGEEVEELVAVYELRRLRVGHRLLQCGSPPLLHLDDARHVAQVCLELDELVPNLTKEDCTMKLNNVLIRFMNNNQNVGSYVCCSSLRHPDVKDLSKRTLVLLSSESGKEGCTIQILSGNAELYIYDCTE